MCDKKRNFILVAGVFFLIACGEKKNVQQDYPVVEPIPESPEVITTEQSDSIAFPGFSTFGKDTVKLSNGLAYILINDGKGPKAKKGKRVSVHYTGYLKDGTEFDSSIDKGQPYSFELGSGIVIQGWEEGIAELNKGSKARLIIPHQLGYGKMGRPPVIPPDADLIFDVELVNIE
jgi:peptidylprolyl isomerase